MENSNNNLIFSYIHKELTDAERLAFEAELSTNVELQVEVEQMRELYALLQKDKRSKELKSEISRIAANINWDDIEPIEDWEGNKPPAPIIPIPTPTKKPFPSRIIAIAASILLALGVGYWFTLDNQSFINENFVNYNVAEDQGGVEDLKVIYKQACESNDFSNFMKKIEQTPPPPNTQLTESYEYFLMRTTAEVRTKEYNKALISLAKAEAFTQEYASRKAQILFYQVIILQETKQFATAKAKMQQLQEIKAELKGKDNENLLNSINKLTKVVK